MCRRGGAAFRCAAHRANTMEAAQQALAEAVLADDNDAVEEKRRALKDATISYAATSTGQNDLMKRLLSAVPGTPVHKYLRDTLSAGQQLANSEQEERENDPWVRNGFADGEIADWVRREYTSDQAAAYRNAGFTAEEGQGWNQESFTPQEARRWSKAGAHYSVAREWHNAGFVPDEMTAWVNAGMSDQQEAAEWHNRGFTPEAAAAARRGPRDWSSVKRSDVTLKASTNDLADEGAASYARTHTGKPKDVIVNGQVVGRVVKGFDVERVMNGRIQVGTRRKPGYWAYDMNGNVAQMDIARTQEYAIEDLMRAHELNKTEFPAITPETARAQAVMDGTAPPMSDHYAAADATKAADARQATIDQIERDLGFSPKTAETWANVNPDFAADATLVAKWHREGLHAEYAAAWQRTGFAPGEASAWMRSHPSFTNPTIAEAWREDGFQPGEAAQWKEERFGDPAEAEAWRSQGFAPTIARDWKQSGLAAPDCRAWCDEKFTPAEATEWANVGGPREADNWRQRGFEADEAHDYVLAGHDLESADRDRIRRNQD